MKVDKEKVKNNFSKSAKRYDLYADLQKETIDKLFGFISGRHKRILDVGCGTGILAGMIAEKYPGAEVVGIDLAPGMVEVADTKVKNKNIKFVVGDAEALPFKNSEFDLVVSSASLQWMDPAKAFAEVARVLRPEGEFHFATFGPGTLREIKKAGLAVNEFPKKEKLREVLAGYFRRIELKEEIIAKHFSNVFELFFYLREIGAQYSAKGKREGLLTRQGIYSLFPQGGKGIAATFEIYYGRVKGLL